MYLYLIVLELILDVAAIVFGCVLLFQVSNNKQQRLQGLLSLALGGFLLFDNIQLFIAYRTIAVNLSVDYDLLQIPAMLSGFILLSAVSFFSLFLFRPGYMNRFRFIVLLIPIGAVLLVALCYFLFNGKITPVGSIADVLLYSNELDVRFRLVLFAIAFTLPLVYFIMAIVGMRPFVFRKTFPAMPIFVVSMIVCLFYFTLFTLSKDSFVFYSYRIVLVLLNLTISVLFVLYKTPFFIYNQEVIPDATVNKEALADILYNQMNEYISLNKSFVNTDYSLSDLAGEMNVKSSLLLDVIKEKGFSGFRDYMNYLRIAHFKQLAQSQRSRSIKELMFDSGFVSRSTFYRVFSALENMTPTEYIEQLYRIQE